jgi:hypothetical protein
LLNSAEVIDAYALSPAKLSATTSRGNMLFRGYQRYEIIWRRNEVTEQSPAIFVVEKASGQRRLKSFAQQITALSFAKIVGISRNRFTSYYLGLSISVSIDTNLLQFHKDKHFEKQFLSRASLCMTTQSLFFLGEESASGYFLQFRSGHGRTCLQLRDLRRPTIDL